MNKERKHSKLPFFVIKRGDGVFEIICAGKIIAEVDTLANAEFIATACNEHYALKQRVAELERQNAELEQALTDKIIDEHCELKQQNAELVGVLFWIKKSYEELLQEAGYPVKYYKKDIAEKLLAKAKGENK